MSASNPTIKDLLELKKKKPLLCIPDDYATTTRTSRDDSKKAYYIPVFLNGTKRRLKFRFSQQVNTGRAKAYQGNSADPKKDNNSKKITVTFTKLDENSFEKTVYNPQHYDTLIKNNSELLQMLDVIADEYKDLVNNKLKTTEGPWGYPAVVKDAKFVTFRQTEYKATKEILDEDRKIQDPAKKLINPETGKVRCAKAMYRITVPSNYHDNGSYTKLDMKTAKQPVKKHIPYIFDARYKIANKAGEFQPAVYDNPETGVKEPLSFDNIGKYITSMSVLSGVIEVDSIIYSSAGFSLSIKFDLLYVVPHKIIIRDSVPVEELDGMNDLMCDDDDEVKVLPIKTAPPLQYEDGEQPFDEPEDTNTEEKTLPVTQTKQPDEQDNQDNQEPDDNTETTANQPTNGTAVSQTTNGEADEVDGEIEDEPVETKVENKVENKVEAKVEAKTSAKSTSAAPVTALKKPNKVIKHDEEEVTEPTKPTAKAVAKPAAKSTKTKPVGKA